MGMISFSALTRRLPARESEVGYTLMVREHFFEDKSRIRIAIFHCFGRYLFVFVYVSSFIGCMYLLYPYKKFSISELLFVPHI